MELRKPLQALVVAGNFLGQHFASEIHLNFSEISLVVEIHLKIYLLQEVIAALAF